jgi:molybdate transport system substrate-binding protein
MPFLLINLAGCNPPGSNKKTFTIFVPCSIFAAFCEIMDAYKKDNPDVKINFDTGNTIVLMRKVLNKGARPDIYISTGPLEIKPLIDKGLVSAQTKVTLTTDSIILVTPAGNPKNIRKTSDLSRKDIRNIAIPDPSTNSSGKYALEALEKLNLWGKIKDKVVFTEFGRHTRNFITENKIDAGILYRSCLFEDLKAYDEVIAPKDMYVVSDILKEIGGEIPSSVCILKASKNKKIAQEFINYMLSPGAREILNKWKGKKITSCKVYPN